MMEGTTLGAGTISRSESPLRSITTLLSVVVEVTATVPEADVEAGMGSGLPKAVVRFVASIDRSVTPARACYSISTAINHGMDIGLTRGTVGVPVSLIDVWDCRMIWKGQGTGGPRT